MAALHIYDPRERALVTAGDAVLRGFATLARPFRHRVRTDRPRRILLLRLERIGDLLMALPALGDLRAHVPGAELDLVVGSWNAEVARNIPGISQVHVVDAPWLAREGSAVRTTSMLKAAIGWRRLHYDVAVNLEPDVRSNLLLALSGARWTAGYRSAGGGPLLDQAIEYHPAEHTVDNARRLVSEVFGATPAQATRLLAVPDASRREADALLAGRARPLVAVHASGGRPVKQWPTERFAAVARRLVDSHAATIVLTGGPGDSALVGVMKGALPPDRVVDASGAASLLTVAAILERCELMITGDTGPMHLAAAVGTPIVAVFGPSDPRRYAPRGPLDRVIRVDLACAPCNRIRLPPERCTGHAPDCLAFIPPDRVFEAAASILAVRRVA